jgi:hypothetical protein
MMSTNVVRLVVAVGTGLLLLVLFAGGVRASPNGPPEMEPDAGVVAAAPGQSCRDGVQSSGAAYRICLPVGWPATWNGDLVVYAHGYVAFNRPVGIPEDQMVLPGTNVGVHEIVNLLGYAFAATSYYTNGLAVVPALSDIQDLVDLFSREEATPTNVLLTGVSEGGLITTLSMEQFPEVFDGGLAMCGPYGDFERQTRHLGDFRVVFDYFFPGLIPGSPISIPATLINTWETEYYSTTVLPVLENPANALSITQLLQVTAVPPYEFQPPTSTTSMERLLWYSVFATNDAKAKLNGQPFDNQNRVYRGSLDDAALNAAVRRFSADAAAIQTLAMYYQTSGVLTVPLVMAHTTEDFLVPYWHMPLYQAKVFAADNIALYDTYGIDRFGHCAFTAQEILDAFDALTAMVANPPPYQPVRRGYLPLVLRAGY